MDEKKASRLHIEDLPQELVPGEMNALAGGVAGAGLVISSFAAPTSLLGGCQAIGGIATQVNL